jgi:hypothetical protein
MALVDAVKSYIRRPIEVLRPILGVAAFVYAVVLVLWLTRLECQPRRALRWHLVFWTVGPPLWFATEYFALDTSYADPNKRLLVGQDVASKLWAAVLVLLLYFYPGGPFCK